MQAVRLEIPMAGGHAAALHWRGPDRPRAAPIHFAHANGFNAETYRSVLSPLAQRGPVYASDLRGHGRSRLPATPDLMTSWKLYAEDIVAVLERLPGGPFVLGGHSMGGTASLIVAATRPDLVKALVLAEPVILPRGYRLITGAMKALGLYDRVMPMASQAARRRRHWPSVQAALDSYRGRGAFRNWPEDILKDYLTGGLTADPNRDGMVLACAPEWEAANYKAGPPDTWSLLRKIRAPVMLLTGGQGSTCPVPLAQLLALRVKGLKWQHYPEASHFLPMEFPHTVADSLQAMAE